MKYAISLIFSLFLVGSAQAADTFILPSVIAYIAGYDDARPNNCSNEELFTTLTASHMDNPNGYSFEVTECEFNNSKNLVRK